MQTNERIITPVLLGADLNCYNVARAFHEAYGVISYAFGRYPIGATMHSRIVRFTAVENFNNSSVMVDTLDEFAREHNRRGETLILIGCTDEYVNLIIANKPLLHRYVTPYIDQELSEDITLKDHFYGYCEKFGIPYPKTWILKKGDKLELPPEQYPVIVKPSSSIEYWHHPFDGMKKVYRAYNEAQAVKIIGDIFDSGYSEKIIVQDMIPGDDQQMYTMTAYCNREGKVVYMCLGHVLLEEHTPKGLGNHAAILTTRNDELALKLKDFLEAIHYRGFANFDIKYDTRDSTFKLFEVNIRQGRSNYYVTASGMNIARLIVEDWVEEKPYTGCKLDCEEIYWRYIPDSIVYKYSDPENIARVRALKKAGKAFSSMRYAYDLRMNPWRWAFVHVHEFKHIGKYKKYYNKKELS